MAVLPQEPARKIKPNWTSLTGRFVAEPDGKVNAHESALERDLMTLAAFDPQIRDFTAQPYRFEYQAPSTGRTRNYYPDLAVAFRDDLELKELDVEVKYRAELSSEKAKEDLVPKFKAGFRHCQANDAVFKVLTEDEIRTPFLGTAQFVQPAQAFEPNLEMEDRLLRAMESLKECTIDCLLDQIGPKEERADIWPIFWRLIAQRRIWMDLRAPLRTKNVVRVAEAPDPQFLWTQAGPPFTQEDRERAREARTVKQVWVGVVPFLPAVGELVRWKAANCLILEAKSGNKVLLRNVKTGYSDIVPISELSGIDNGLCRDPKRDIDLVTLDPSKIVASQRRLEAILPLTEGRNSQLDYEEAAAKVGVKHWTIRRNLRDLRRMGGNLKALLRPSPSGGRGKARTDGEAETVLQYVLESFYLTPQKPSGAEAAGLLGRLCRSLGIKSPHPNTVLNRIKRIPWEERTRRREGKAYASRMIHLDRGEFDGAKFPGHIYQLDHTKADVQLVDPDSGRHIGRAFLSVVTDVYSRAVVGFQVSLDPVGSVAVALAMVHAIQQKGPWLRVRGIDSDWNTSGFPAVTHTDCGGDLLGEPLQLFCAEQGIRLERRPTGSPNFGAHVESVIRNTMRKVHLIPGTTFSNIKERLEYDSEGLALLTLKDFEKWLAVFFTKIYNVDSHEGIDGQSPFKRYEEGISGVDGKVGSGYRRQVAVEGEEDLLVSLLPIERRTVGQTGIQVDRKTFSAGVLQKFLNEKDPKNKGKQRQFVIRIDPRDFTAIWFKDPDSGKYFKIPQRSKMPPLSHWEWKKAKAYANKKHKGQIDEELIYQGHLELQQIARTAAQTMTSRRDEARRKITMELDLHGTNAALKASQPHQATGTEGLATNVVELDVKAQSAKPRAFRPFTDDEE